MVGGKGYRYLTVGIIAILVVCMGINFAMLVRAYVWPGPSPGPAPTGGRIVIESVHYVPLKSVAGYPEEGNYSMKIEVYLFNNYSTSRMVCLRVYVDSEIYPAGGNFYVNAKSSLVLSMVLNLTPFWVSANKVNEFTVKVYSASSPNAYNLTFEGSVTKDIYIANTVRVGENFSVSGLIKVPGAINSNPNVGNITPGNYTIQIIMKNNVEESIEKSTSFAVFLLDGYGHILWPRVGGPSSYFPYYISSGSCSKGEQCLTEVNGSLTGLAMNICASTIANINLPFKYITHTMKLYLYILYNGTIYQLANATIVVHRTDIVNVHVSCTHYYGINYNRNNQQPLRLTYNVTFTLNKNYYNYGIYPNPVNISLVAFNSSLDANNTFPHSTQISLAKSSVILSPNHPKATIRIVVGPLFAWYGVTYVNYSLPVPFQIVAAFRIKSKMHVPWQSANIPYESRVITSGIVGIYDFINNATFESFNSNDSSNKMAKLILEKLLNVTNWPEIQKKIKLQTLAMEKAAEDHAIKEGKNTAVKVTIKLIFRQILKYIGLDDIAEGELLEITSDITDFVGTLALIGVILLLTHFGGAGIVGIYDKIPYNAADMDLVQVTGLYKV